MAGGLRFVHIETLKQERQSIVANRNQSIYIFIPHINLEYF